MKKLKEHRIFRNQLVFFTLVLFVMGFGLDIIDFIGFGFIFAVLAIWNILTYSENVKDYKKLKGGDF
jgi:uncharacterized membrane protein